MGSISGPIIRFRFDAPSAQQAAKQLSQTVSSTMARASKSSAQQFVSDYQAAAAKLRASLTSEKLGLNQIVQAREKIIGLAQREMSVLQKKNALTKADYALLKNATLEIEKQRNALQGFGAITSPTRKIIQQMMSGISARAGSYGGGMGSFAGVRVNESIGKMADEATGGKLALLALGGASVVAGAAMLKMAKDGAELAVSMRNASEAAGISIKSMAELKSAASALGVDSDVTVKMFRKFNQELTYAAGASLPHASIEAKRAAEVFQLLGVNVKKAAADPMEGLRELSAALSKLPEGAIKSATEVMLLGRGGQEAAPLINHLSEAILATKDSSDELASKIGGAAEAGDKLAAASANLSNEWHSLEVNLSTVFVPLLSGIANMVNGLFGGARMAASSPKQFLGGLLGPALGIYGVGMQHTGGVAAAHYPASVLSIPGMFRNGIPQHDRIDTSNAVLAANYARNMAYAKGGPYITKLSAAEEQRFKLWVKQNKIPWQDTANADYDMRGYWKAQQMGNPIAARAANLHFPDQWKTPYDATFSNESQYATHAAPHWVGNTLVPTNTGGVTGRWMDAAGNAATLNKLAGAVVSDSTGRGKGAYEGEPMRALLRKDLAAINKYLREKKAAHDKELHDWIRVDERALKSSKDAARKSAEAWKKELHDRITQDERALHAAQENARKIAEVNKKKAEEVINAWRRLQDEGRSLFSALLSGGRNFSQELVHDLENIALGPVQKAFGNIFANIFLELGKIVPSIGGKAGAGGKGPGGWLGKIWKGIQAGIQPPKSVQQAIQMLNPQITANTVIVNGPASGAGGSAAAGGLLGLLGGNNFSATNSTGGLLGLLAGNNVPANVYSGGLLSLIGGNRSSTSTGSAAVAGGIVGGPLYQGVPSRASQVGSVLASAIPGAVLLGSGIATRNGAAMATGIGMAGGPLLTSLSNIPALSKLGANLPGMSKSATGNLLGNLGAALPGIGMMFAGNQTGGLGGAAMGALGGAQAGLALGGPIGAAIGAIAGGLMGAFGKKNNAQAWQNHVTKAMNNQRITLPPSENFAFASMGSMAQTMSTTFGQGPGGTFSNSTLAANTPFSANAILGTPRGWQNQIKWNELMNGLNPNAPFYGGSINPFAGGTLPPNYPFGGGSGLPNGLRLPRGGDAYSQNAGLGGVASPQSGVQVHFTVPGYVDKAGLADIVKNAAPLIHATVSQSVYRQNTGMRRAIMKGVNLA